MTRTYAVGNFNAISRLDNHTGPWVDLTALGNADSQWRDVMCDPIDPDKVVIVGSSNQAGNASIQVSTDAGVTWVVPGGDWIDACDFFHEVWYVDTNIIWAINSSGLVVKSIDGGANFNLVTTIGLTVPGDTFWTSAIHALDDQIAVVLGSPTGGISEPNCYVWKTTDGGTTWNLLNSGSSLTTALINPTTGQVINTVGASNGIWISPDQQKIITATGYLQHRSIDGGATFLDAGIDMHRSGIHLTWFPTYDADPQYFRHTGGSPLALNDSVDNGVSYSTTRAYEPGTTGIIPPSNLPIQILGAHFYAPLDGYYGYHDQGTAFIDHTTNGGITGTLSHTNTTPGASYEAIWTSVEQPPFTPCFELSDCAGILPSIFTQSDLSGQDGQVVTLADDTNHEIENQCWLVTATDVSCPDTVEVAVYRCFEDCDTCLPPEPPIQLPCPRPVDPGYNTGLCDPAIVENALCTFGEMMYQQMMSKRFKIDYCCLPDEENVIIRHEKIKMKLMESENPTPDPCNPECYAYQIDIDPADSAITTYVDCFEEEQTIITPVGSDASLVRTVGFCALDSTPPTTVVTHPDTSTDTYILERVEECTPPWVDPRACVGYHVEMSNFTSGDQTFRYLDCDGVEQVITKPGGFKNIAQYNFCGLEGQTIEREEPFAPSDVFTVDESDSCTGLPPCRQYVVTLNSGSGGHFDYIDCDGNDATQEFPATKADIVFIICGIQGQTLTCPACNNFSYVETGDC